MMNLGPRFPDMSEPYTVLSLIKIAEEARTWKTGSRVQKGVYVAVAGSQSGNKSRVQVFKSNGRRCRWNVNNT
jgi:purine nucleoside phosphorylase